MTSTLDVVTNVLTGVSHSLNRRIAIEGIERKPQLLVWEKTRRELNGSSQPKHQHEHEVNVHLPPETCPREELLILGEISQDPIVLHGNPSHSVVSSAVSHFKPVPPTLHASLIVVAMPPYLTGPFGTLWSWTTAP